MENGAYESNNVPKCEIGIDYNECKCRGMCSSYALYQYSHGYSDGINHLIEMIKKQQIVDENTLSVICETAENIMKK